MHNTPTLASAKRSLGSCLLVVALLGASAVRERSLAADIDVWIDPGHGGRDSGATGFNKMSLYPEKQATLAPKAATRVSRKATIPSTTTWTTRTTRACASSRPARSSA
jgi:N-acetylmuramoyl-L-alanine amidase